jgi:hypothetical protein
MVFDPFVAVGGYVTDVLLTIQIDAKVSTECHVLFDNMLPVVVSAAQSASYCMKLQPFVCTAHVVNVQLYSQRLRSFTVARTLVYTR